jgi:Protein of unknown function, DUF488
MTIARLLQPPTRRERELRGLAIKTSSWLAPLPDGYIRIGISRGTPRGIIGYRVYRKLAPGPWFNSTPDPAEWEARYRAEVLSRLTPQQVLGDLLKIANGKTPVLCCFERAGSGHWCHRSLAASWLAQGLGQPVPELGFESLPQALHPMRPLRPPERPL